MDLIVPGHHLLREEGGAGTGAYTAQQCAGFYVIAAEAAIRSKIPLDEGHIVVIPQFAHHIMVKVQGHFAVVHFKNFAAQLLCAHNHIVCQRVPTKQRLAAGPVVVLFGHRRHTLHGGKGTVTHKGVL